MWKNREDENAAPAVRAHFHALRAEAAWKREDFVQAEHECRVASERFVEAANHIHDKRTIDALFLLAENYEYRANEARGRLSEISNRVKSDEPNNTRSDIKPRKDEHVSLPPRPLSSRIDEQSTQPSAAAEAQLNQAAAEMEELWRRLNELGLSSTGNSDKTHLLMSSRHLSSSLGDSFCLLPTKNRTSVGVHASAVDGASTLRAAVASRMRNQRVRLMEKQYGPRAPVAHPPTSNSLQESEPVNDPNHARGPERRNSGINRGHTNEPQETDNTNETFSHQKHEIVRLLNTVKTLSIENTKLLKKCDALAQVQEENRELQQSMEHFKTHYNQKLVMIKRALEEWRRQQRSQSEQNMNPSVPPIPTSAELDEQLQQQRELRQLQEAIKMKDEQLAKYEKWYQTLKAGARAKRSALSSGDGGRNGVVRDSFTNSNSLHDFSENTTSTTEPTRTNSGSRPPPHPNQRTL